MVALCLFLCSLNLHAQKLFQSLGSSYIDQLTFRDVWGFVGQKGIVGHSPIEQVHVYFE